MNTKEIDTDLVNSIVKLNRFFKAKKIDFDELASNLIIRLVDCGYDNVEECLRRLDAADATRFESYSKDYFKKNGFRPHPGVFMVETNDPEKVEAKREQLKPKYESLMAHIEKAVAVLNKSDK